MKFLILSFFSLLSTVSFSQKYTVKNINPKSFDIARYGNDTIYNAIIEHNIGNSYFSFSSAGNLIVIHEVKKRIHILKKDGYHYGDITIPLYKKDRSNSENLKIKDAYTYNLVDGKVVRTKFNEKETYEDKYIGNTWYVSFSMPDVKEGSIIEYTTEVTSPFYSDIPEWYFQQEIPVKYSEYQIVIPKRIIFLNYTKGNISLKQSVIDGGYIYSAQNIPAMVNEGHIDNINNYKSSVVYLYNGFRKRNGKAMTYSGDWPEVIKTIHEHNRLGGQLTDIDFCKDKANELTKDINSTKDKIETILSYVQQNYYWNNTYSLGSNQALKDVYTSRRGNSADINLLLIAFLRNVGVMAYPVVLSTVNHGAVYVPHVDAFNQLIVGVQMGSQTHLLDATNKYSEIDIIPLQNLNRTGRIVINENKSMDLSLEPNKLSKSQINAYLSFVEGNNSLKGIVRENSTHYQAYRGRNYYDEQTDEDIKKLLENHYLIDIDSLKIENRNTKNTPLKEFYSFTREKSYDFIGDKIYLSPTFMYGIKESPFKQKERHYPIFFHYPSEDVYNITYEIPEGYEVEYIPESKVLKLSDNSLEFSWKITYDDQRIRISITNRFSQRFIDSSNYQAIKAIYEDYLKFNNEKIVLKKI